MSVPFEPVIPEGFVPVDVYNRCKDRLIHAEANYGEELKRARAFEAQAQELSAKLAQLGQQTDQQTEELQAAATLAQSLIGPLEVNAQGGLLFVGITPISCEDPAILEALEALLSAALRRS